MIYQISTIIVSALNKNGTLHYDDDREIIIYGFFSMLSKLFYAIVCGIFGLLFRCLFESFLFYTSFLFIKKYAGGFHCSTEGRCMIVSSLSIFLSICYIYFSSFSKTLTTIIILISLLMSIVIVAFSPVAAKEKPLNDDELIKYKRYSLIRVFIMLLLLSILYFHSYYRLSVPFCCSLSLEGLLLIAGKVKNSVDKHKKIPSN